VSYIIVVRHRADPKPTYIGERGIATDRNEAVEYEGIELARGDAAHLLEVWPTLRFEIQLTEKVETFERWMPPNDYFLADMDGKPAAFKRGVLSNMTDDRTVTWLKARWGM
jgi:hypothetical protein